MSNNHHHHFCVHPRGTGEAKAEQSKLKMLHAHCEPHIALVGLQVRNMEISVLQVQRYHSVSGDESRPDLSILNLSLRRKKLRGRRSRIGQRPPSFFGTRK